MSPDSSTVTSAPSLQNRLHDVFAARRDKMFGVVEIFAFGLSCLILFFVILSYLYFLLPARSRLASLKADQVQLKTNIQKSQSIVSRERDVKQTADKIVASLDKFENVSLVEKDTGRMELYDRLNQMIVKNGLRNTSGPTYTALEPIGGKVTPGKSMSTKWQSYYPGIAVDVTVEGSYQNLRHFIRDIEASKQFVIINQVELQKATNNNSSVPTEGTPATEANAATPATGPRSLVSLQLNMAIYFQRVASSNSTGAAQK